MRRELILASASPRRSDLLKAADMPFTLFVARADESTEEKAPDKIVEELSIRKAEEVASRLNRDAYVLGADTVVSLDGEVFGKPMDEKDAFRMLELLQGREHHVFTGFTLLELAGGSIIRRHTESVRTEVFVRRMDREEILRYIDTGEPMDKAGAYGIQGIFSRYIEKINGDYSSVVGLPVSAVYETLRSWERE